MTSQNEMVKFLEIYKPKRKSYSTKRPIGTNDVNIKKF